MRIGIENISVFGLPPVEFVNLAADLGCQHISTGLTSYPFGVHDYAPFSLRDDAKLRREMIAAMKDRGVSISLGEGFMIKQDGAAKDFEPDLDLFAELGAERINTLSMDPDFNRMCDQFAVMAELTAARGIRVTTELVPGLPIGSVASALTALKQIGRPDFRLLLDTMHIVRSGSTVAEVAAIDPELIDYVQICDAPLTPRFDSYFEEAMFERMVPGTGELGLSDLLAVLPADRVYAIEVPLRTDALAGAGPYERMERCVSATRQMLAIAHKEAAQ